MFYAIAVWLHVLAACIWVGGLLFFVLVVAPVARGMDRVQALAVIRQVGGRFRTVGWASLGMLVVSGTFNTFYRWLPIAQLGNPQFWSGSFGRALALKLVLVALTLVASVGHDRLGSRATDLLRANPESTRGVQLRRAASWLGRAEAFLAMAIVFLAVVLVRGY